MQTNEGSCKEGGGEDSNSNIHILGQIKNPLTGQIAPESCLAITGQKAKEICATLTGQIAQENCVAITVQIGQESDVTI